MEQSESSHSFLLCTIRTRSEDTASRCWLGSRWSRLAQSRPKIRQEYAGCLVSSTYGLSRCADAHLSVTPTGRRGQGGRKGAASKDYRALPTHRAPAERSFETIQRSSTATTHLSLVSIKSTWIKNPLRSVSHCHLEHVISGLSVDVYSLSFH